MLLKSSGYRVEQWVQPPGALTEPASTTLILAEPAEAPTPGDRQAIREFLTRGGRVIVTGSSGALFLDVHVVPTPLSDATPVRVPAVAASAIGRAAPTITISPQSAWNHDDAAATLYGTDAQPRVVRLPANAGEAYWWAAATPLTNAGLRQPGNLEFFLASIGTAPERRVLFDESFTAPVHRLPMSP